MSLTCLVYDVFIWVYAGIIRLVRPFHPKALQWVKGRKNWYRSLERSLGGRSVDLWMHCASLGEFEQGRPLLEALRKNNPGQFFLLTFFSPSGYEVRKNYPLVNHVCYLPLDTKKNARRFTLLVKPGLAIFVKYEFWMRFLQELHHEAVPILLISAIFRPHQLFFKWYGIPFRKLLSYYQRIFVQDEKSARLLGSFGIKEVTIAGDTRFDRVVEMADQALNIPGITGFLHDREALVAGSTWPKDELLLEKSRLLLTKMIIAPHEVSEIRLRQIENLFGDGIIRYSVWCASRAPVPDYPILLVDNIGMLSALYRYGAMAYIGGGFDQGIHNTLEAAVYGIPLIFGPGYHKFQEALDLLKLQCARSVRNENELKTALETLRDEQERKSMGLRSGKYVRDHTGATGKILDYIQENRFLIK